MTLAGGRWCLNSFAINSKCLRVWLKNIRKPSQRQETDSPVFVFYESVFRTIAAACFNERAVSALPRQRVLFPLFKKQLLVAFRHFGYIFFKDIPQFVILKDKMVASIHISVVFNG